MNKMPSVSIQHCRCKRLSEKKERLTLDATVRGQAREIIVDISRYEKRPVFMIRNWGELGDYQSKDMSALLNQVVLAYAVTQDASNISETL